MAFQFPAPCAWSSVRMLRHLFYNISLLTSSSSSPYKGHSCVRQAHTYFVLCVAPKNFHLNTRLYGQKILRTAASPSYKVFFQSTRATRRHLVVRWRTITTHSWLTSSRPHHASQCLLAWHTQYGLVLGKSFPRRIVATRASEPLPFNRVWYGTVSECATVKMVMGVLCMCYLWLPQWYSVYSKFFTRWWKLGGKICKN